MIEKAMADSMRAGSLGSAGGMGMGMGTGMIIGGQPPLDVDALLRRTHSEDIRSLFSITIFKQMNIRKIILLILKRTIFIFGPIGITITITFTIAGDHRVQLKVLRAQTLTR
jgi:hypothetical protein